MRMLSTPSYSGTAPCPPPGHLTAMYSASVQLSAQSPNVNGSGKFLKAGTAVVLSQDKKSLVAPSTTLTKFYGILVAPSVQGISQDNMLTKRNKMNTNYDYYSQVYNAIGYESGEILNYVNHDAQIAVWAEGAIEVGDLAQFRNVASGNSLPGVFSSTTGGSVSEDESVPMINATFASSLVSGTGIVLLNLR